MNVESAILACKIPMDATSEDVKVDCLMIFRLFRFLAIMGR